MCTEQHQCTSLPKIAKLVAVGGPQLNRHYQSTAAATEANPGAFPGLFGCSQHPKSKPGRKNIFRKKNSISGSTVVQVEGPLPEHCCSYGSKPGCLWGPFWLFLAVENQAGPKNIFCKKKWVYGGPMLCKLKYRCQSTAAAMAANPGGFGGRFGCS